MYKKYLFNRKLLVVLSLIAVIAVVISFYENKVQSAQSNMLDQLNLKYAEKSNYPIEVVFVSAEKDFDILVLSIESIRKYLSQPISKIVLVAPKSEASLKIAKDYEIEFLDEADIFDLGIFKKWLIDNKIEMNHTPTWYYQQFLKLMYARHTVSDHYFIVDADIIFMKPFVMYSEYGITTYYIGGNSGREMSQTSTERIFQDSGIYKPEFSFISDLMLFDSSVVRNMLDFVEEKSNLPFYQAAMFAEKSVNISRFSEYEMYGIYANFYQKNKSILPRFVPKSKVVSARSKLKNNNNKVKNYYIPYIAYHHYLNP
jgi:hypothetical protein